MTTCRSPACRPQPTYACSTYWAGQCVVARARLPLLGMPTGLYLLQGTERGQPTRQARVYIE